LDARHSKFYLVVGRRAEYFSIPKNFLVLSLNTWLNYLEII
jgi:hypothetical protein